MISKKRKVLIFGQKVFGPQKPTVSIDYCDVHTSLFPQEYEKLPRLVDYDLVLLDYSAFDLAGTVYESQQEIFEKQMLEALGAGTCFCILHYQEQAPLSDSKVPGTGYIDTKAVASCRRKEIGFRWLEKFQIRVVSFESPKMSALVNRNEFKLFQERWGSSKNAFIPYSGGNFSDVILSLETGEAVGFALSQRRGKILYLPCVRDFGRPQLVTECLECLINGIITYLTRSSTELPSWAATPFFSSEGKLHSELSELQSRVSGLQHTLQPYETAKLVAFKSEYEFEEAVPEFFTASLELPTARHEEFKEDFWILDSESEKIVIAETKSYVRGFKKGGIYRLYIHRESNGLDIGFPALLVVNAHLNAGSWEDKIRPIDPQDFKCAAENNILIMRTEDILFFWNSIMEERHSKEELLTTILKEKGWAEVSADGNITLHR